MVVRQLRTEDFRMKNLSEIVLKQILAKNVFEFSVP